MQLFCGQNAPIFLFRTVIIKHFIKKNCFRICSRTLGGARTRKQANTHICTRAKMYQPNSWYYTIRCTLFYSRVVTLNPLHSTVLRLSFSWHLLLLNTKTWGKKGINFPLWFLKWLFRDISENPVQMLSFAAPTICLKIMHNACSYANCTELYCTDNVSRSNDLFMPFLGYTVVKLIIDPCDHVPTMFQLFSPYVSAIEWSWEI